MHRTLAAVALVASAWHKANAQGSQASCDFSVKAEIDKRERDALVQQGFGLATFLCDEGDHSDVEVTDYFSGFVSASAEAYARATVSSVLKCNINGNGNGNFNARGHAETRASASAQAILSGWAQVSTCEGCDQYVETFLNSTKAVFVSAAVEFEESFEILVNDGENDQIYEERVVEDIKQEIIDTWTQYTVTLYASLTTVNNSVSQTCGIALDACAGTDHTSCCKWASDANSYAEYTDAVAVAAIEIPLEDVDCKGGTFDKYYSDVASALASAFASASSSVFAMCKTEHEGNNACIWGQSTAEGFAEATATAIAEAWVATSPCGCTPDAPTIAQSFETVVASAVAEITGEICVEDEAELQGSLVLSAWERNLLPAVADVFASVWTNDEWCSLSGPDVRACTGEADPFATCLDRDTQKTCRFNFSCVLRTETLGVCQPPEYRPRPGELGTIVTCPEPVED